jgi:hypothetical protein
VIGKKFEEIGEDDLNSLVRNCVYERKTIEYKESLNVNTRSERREFLAEVSSFANASGGDIVFGISQDRTTGQPRELKGLELQNPDQEILKIEALIRDGIEPRIPSARSKAIVLSNSRIALVVRIEKSWRSPHRVSFAGHGKFYSRGSNGKFPMDVQEIRDAFTISFAVDERIRAFREDRISSIYANETPVPFYENASIVLQLIPPASFSPGQRYDIGKIAEKPTVMAPMYCQNFNYRYNLDGFLTYSSLVSGKAHSYVQLYRSGMIEAVDGLLLKPRGEELLIQGRAVEQELINALPQYLIVLETLEVHLPVLVFLTFVKVKGYSMIVDTGYIIREGQHAIDRDILLLQEIVLENYNVSAEKVLKPAFDSFWNACGFPKSPNYDAAGNWRA